MATERKRRRSGRRHGRCAPVASPSQWRVHSASAGGVILLSPPSRSPAVARADALDDQVREISKGLRCPVCSGETVADSHAPISVQMRGIIREKLEAGESPEQIRAYFVTRYGPEILLSPQTSGFTLGVWVMPIFALIIGFLIVLAVLRSWSRRGEPVAAPPSAAPADEAAQLPAGR